MKRPDLFRLRLLVWDVVAWGFWLCRSDLRAAYAEHCRHSRARGFFPMPWSLWAPTRWRPLILWGDDGRV